MLKLVGEDVPSIEEFMSRYRVSPFASRRIHADTGKDGSSCRTTQITRGCPCHGRTFQRGGS